MERFPPEWIERVEENERKQQELRRLKKNQPEEGSFQNPDLDLKEAQIQDKPQDKSEDNPEQNELDRTFIAKEENQSWKEYYYICRHAAFPELSLTNRKEKAEKFAQEWGLNGSAIFLGLIHIGLVGVCIASIILLSSCHSLLAFPIVLLGISSCCLCCWGCWDFTFSRTQPPAEVETTILGCNIICCSCLGCFDIFLAAISTPFVFGAFQQTEDCDETGVEILRAIVLIMWTVYAASYCVLCLLIPILNPICQKRVDNSLWEQLEI